MKNTLKNIKTTNTTLDEIPAEILEDISNARAMFARGFVHYDYIYIKKLQSTKPKDLDAFDDAMRENSVALLYVIEIDKDKERNRGCRFWSPSGFVACTIGEGGHCVPWTRTSADYKHSTPYGKDFKRLEGFWRKSDYEEARKVARSIWCVYQPNHGAEIISKQEQRENAREGALCRYTVTENRPVYCRGGGCCLNELYTRDDRGQVKNWGSHSRYYYSYNEEKFADADALLRAYFDASGFYVKDNRGTMRARVEMLRKQRARERLAVNNYTKETADLEKTYTELLASFKAITDKFLELTANHTPHRVFWFTTRLERTADQINDLADTIGRIKDKTYDGDLALFDEYRKEKTASQHVILKNRAWLDIPDDERADRENLKDNAIYYGYVEYKTDQNGDCVEIILDLEKTAQKLASRGY